MTMRADGAADESAAGSGDGSADVFAAADAGSAHTRRMAEQ